MGYYVEIKHSDVVLPTEIQDEVLTRWKKLNGPQYNHVKRGGSWSGGKQTDYWYSWMAPDYDKTVQSVAEVLDMMGFEFQQNEKGDILVKGYDNKTGQEDFFFEQIGDLIEEGQMIQWSGEDGASWAWYFDGAHMNNLNVSQAISLQKAVKSGKTLEVKSPTKKKKNRYRI